MKKRILALALAGTTAFSVFGAAVSANAASTHVVYANDAYVSYQPASVTVDSNKVDSTQAEVHKLVKQTSWTKAAEANGKAINDTTYKGLDKLATVQGVSANVEEAMKALYTPVTTLYVTSTADGIAVTGLNEGGTAVTGFTGKFYMDVDGVVHYAGKVEDADATKLLKAITDSTNPADKGFAANQLINADEKVKDWIADNKQYQELYDEKITKEAVSYDKGALTNYGNGTISDAELSRDGETIDYDTVYA